MRVIRLLVKAIKGVRKIEILANPTLNEIAGPNGAGKSSVLDAIVYAFGGKRAIESKPLRDGEEKGEVVVETEDLTVRRRFSENGDSKLEVAAKDGKRLGQRELDALLSRFSFDPLSFSRAPAAEQVSILQGLIGAEFSTALGALDAKIEAAAEERRMLGRDLARTGAIPEVQPADPVDVSDLTARLKAAEEHNADQRRLESDLDVLRQRAAQQRHEVHRLDDQLTAARALYESIMEQVRSTTPPEPICDTAPLLSQLTAAGATNQRAQAYEAYRVRLAESQRLAQEANAADDLVSLLRQQRLDLQHSARLPVEGVTFGDAGLRVSGIPFDQLASSERIRISARIGMAVSGGLRVLFVRDGSLLDDNSFGELRRLAEEMDVQLWVESVGQGHGDAYVLEAGEVAQMPLSAAESL